MSQTNKTLRGEIETLKKTIEKLTVRNIQLSGTVTKLTEYVNKSLQLHTRYDKLVETLNKQLYVQDNAISRLDTENKTLERVISNAMKSRD